MFQHQWRLGFVIWDEQWQGCCLAVVMVVWIRWPFWVRSTALKIHCIRVTIWCEGVYEGFWMLGLLPLKVKALIIVRFFLTGIFTWHLVSQPWHILSRTWSGLRMILLILVICRCFCCIPATPFIQCLWFSLIVLPVFLHRDANVALVDGGWWLVEYRVRMERRGWPRLNLTTKSELVTWQSAFAFPRVSSTFSILRTATVNVILVVIVVITDGSIKWEKGESKGGGAGVKVEHDKEKW